MFRTLIALFVFCAAAATDAATFYPDLDAAECTQYPDLMTVKLTIPETRYPDFDQRATPRVTVYLRDGKQFADLQTFASCVPAIDFDLSLNVPAWVTDFPTYEWTGDDGDRYFTTGDLVTFTRKYTQRNPSFAERVRFDYVEAHELGYPLRGGHWKINGNKNPSAELVRYHLLYNPNHRGKFSDTYLNRLTREELLSLHDDDHEGRVATEFVNRQPETKVVVAAASDPPTTKPEPAKTETRPGVENRTRYSAAPQSPAVNLYQRPNTARRVFRRRGGCPNGMCPY